MVGRTFNNPLCVRNYRRNNNYTYNHLLTMNQINELNQSGKTSSIVDFIVAVIIFPVLILSTIYTILTKHWQILAVIIAWLFVLSLAGSLLWIIHPLLFWLVIAVTALYFMYQYFDF